MRLKIWAKTIPVLCCSALLAPAQPKDPSLAALAQGMDAYQEQDYATAAARLSQAHIPQLADYVAYYLASARVEEKQYTGVAAALAPVHRTQIPSPLAGRAWLVEAKALQASQPAEAVRLLREHYSELPEPDGNLALGEACANANDLKSAAEFYERVYAEHVTGDAALTAEAALSALKSKMGRDFPPLLPEQEMERADRLREAHQWQAAKAGYEMALSSLLGAARDRARLRIGQTDLAQGNASEAMSYLRALELPASDEDAERLYWEVECARRMNDETAMTEAVEALAARYPNSRWRLKGMVSAAAHWLAENRADQFVPLYRAAYETFPNDSQAGICHWRVAFQAYLHDQPDAATLLREQLERYPASSASVPALYFLGRYEERHGNPGTARACYERLERARPNQFYAVVARERLAQVAHAPVPEQAARFVESLRFEEPRPLPAEETRLTALRIERSRLLREAGLNDLADAELRFGARMGAQPVLLGMEMGEHAEAPYLALRDMKAMAGDYLDLRFDQAPRRFWEMLFPLPFRSQLEAGAKANGVDPFLLAGLIRQESEFNPAALSRANAYGLTQVLPVTARQFARKAGMTRFTARQLFQPATSLRIGSAVLHWMLEQNGGKLEQTLAAYNAGPHRAAEWAGWANYREPAEFVESIPFPETHEYVQAVLRNADIYRRLYQ